MAQTIMGIFDADELHGSGQYFNPCQLRPYDQHCPKPLTAHHCIPDHCWKPSGGTARINLGNPATEMSHNDGLCICVDGYGRYSNTDTGQNYDRITATKAADFGEIDKLITKAEILEASKKLANKFKAAAQGNMDGTTKISDHNNIEKNYYNALGKHAKIHHIFDAAEDELARMNATPPPGRGANVATLDQLENLAADVLSKVTGCDRNDLFEQIREYHDKKGISKDTLLRAKASGKKSATPTPPNSLGGSVTTSSVNNGIGTHLNTTYTRLGI